MEVYKDREWLKKHFFTKGLTLKKIAELAGTHEIQIWRYARRFGFKRERTPMSKEARERSHQTKLSKTTYKVHGVISTPTSFKYRDKDWLIEKYQKEKLSMKKIGNLCSVTMHCILRWMNHYNIPRRDKVNFNEKNGRWTGGVITHSGYRLIKSTKHPQANASGYMREHRLVMETFLGRYLTANEHVHHKDGDKINNSIDNLQLFTNSEHKCFEQALQLFIKKVLHSNEPQYQIPYRKDLLERFQNFLSMNR